jgi:hypothetical protein
MEDGHVYVNFGGMVQGVNIVSLINISGIELK